MVHSQSILKWASQVPKQKREQHSHAEWWGRVQILSEKNANALKSAVWAVGCCVLFCLLLLWDFFFPCFFFYIPEFAICKKPSNASWITVAHCTAMQYWICKNAWQTLKSHTPQILQGKGLTFLGDQVNQGLCGCGGWATDGVSPQKMI